MGRACWGPGVIVALACLGAGVFAHPEPGLPGASSRPVVAAMEVELAPSPGSEAASSPSSPSLVVRAELRRAGWVQLWGLARRGPPEVLAVGAATLTAVERGRVELPVESIDPRRHRHVVLVFRDQEQGFEEARLRSAETIRAHDHELIPGLVRACRSLSRDGGARWYPIYNQ